MATEHVKTAIQNNHSSLSNNSEILEKLPIYKWLYPDDSDKSECEQPFSSPGPSTYNVTSLDSIRPRAPHYTLTGRPTEGFSQNGPGPGAQRIVPLERYKQAAPRYTFGMKHSKKQIHGPIHEFD